MIKNSILINEIHSCKTKEPEIHKKKLVKIVQENLPIKFRY